MGEVKDNPKTQEEFFAKMNDLVDNIVTKSENMHEMQKSLTELQTKITEKASEIALSNSEYKEKFETAKEEFNKEIESLKSQIVELGKSRKKFDLESTDSPIKMLIKGILDSPEYSALVSKQKGVKQASFMIEKDFTTSITDNNTGDLFITNRSNRVEQNPQNRKDHVRNHISSFPLEGDGVKFAFTEVYEMNRQANALDENGRLKQSNFKVKDADVAVTRIGTHVTISRWMLESRIFMEAWLMANIPQWVSDSEDFQLIFGDGENSRATGILKKATNFAEILSNATVVGEAGSVIDIEPFDDGKQTIIVFKNTQSKILDGSYITFSGFANADYNNKFIVAKESDTRILINSPYVSQTGAQVAAVTFTTSHQFLNTIQSPTIADVMLAGAEAVAFGEITPTLFLIDSTTRLQLMTEKNTLGDSISTRFVSFDNNMLTVGGIPVITLKGLKKGQIIVGDFANGCNIIDRRRASLSILTDKEDQLSNKVTIMVDAEIFFPIYNKFAFLQYNINDVKPLLAEV